MIGSEDLIDAFALNHRITQLQTAGLSHADSLIQPPYNGNCMNWVLGHIAVSRDRVLVLLGAHRQLTDQQRMVYETGSDPITSDTPGIIPLETLQEILAASQKGIEERLRALSAAELERPVKDEEDTRSILQRVFGLYFHDTYHTGQTEQLRQLSGTNDKII